MKFVSVFCTAVIFVAITLGAFHPGEAHCAGVAITEVMHHPPNGRLGESFVEIRNLGPASVDLSNARFTRGFQFTFPTNTLIPAGAFLVIAADASSFTNRYPEVTNFLAGWQPPMSSHLRLENSYGQAISELNFSTDGDWAARTLTTNGFAAYGHFGWEWYAPHDGMGNSLELVNDSLPINQALNWTSSAASNGTPGRLNSVATTNAAPIIARVSHSPAIPKSTDAVVITAEILDETRPLGITATVFYRSASTATPPPFASAPMVDDGTRSDGLAGDGVYTATLPAQPNGTVMEFYIRAEDAQGNHRVYPDVMPPPHSSRTANLLYQVDDSAYSGSQPLYRLIMTEIERAELYAIGRKCPDSDSDAQMNTTWISQDNLISSVPSIEVRYNAGVRNRGHGTRQSNPNNYHVNFPADRHWKNMAGINLNSQYAFSQGIGSALFRMAGVPMAQSQPIQLHVNGTNLMSLGLPDANSFGSYAANEQYNADFIQRAFPTDPEGNCYRAVRDQALCNPAINALPDLSWHGANFAIGSYTNGYFKQNNFLENDWSDLIDLIAVLNSANGYQSQNYAVDVAQRLNVEQWMNYMAVNTLLDNSETCLANGFGDDYALYRGVRDTRFLVLPYDLDSVLGRGRSPVCPRHSIFRMATNALPAMDRFMKTPEFVPMYYACLKRLADTLFSPATMNPLLDRSLGGIIPQPSIENMKAFNADQVANVLSQVPLSLSISHELPITSGYPRATASAVSLSGRANAIDTRTVLVNSVPAAWVAWNASWTASQVPLHPGLNRVLVRALGTQGQEIERAYLDVWYDDGNVASSVASITSDTTWKASGGPYQINSTLTIQNGATLTIEPGTTIYLGSGVDLIVANGGRLLSEGSLSAPIRFATAPGSATAWGGMVINGGAGSPETRISHTFLEGNSKTCIEVAGGTVAFDYLSFGTTTKQYLSLDGASFLISNCHFPPTSAAFELVHGTQGIKQNGRGIFRRCFFGTTSGYNDIVDFTGGNRPQQPIIQFYNNVFAGASDDILDLDGTDAWIEGNIFLHVHKNGAPDSSSAVSGGSSGADTSEVTIIGNIFYDCDQAATAKQGNFFTLINNTIVRTTKEGGLDTASGIVNVRDMDPAPTTFGSGFYLEGNIITDAEQLVRNYDGAQTSVVLNNNILPQGWTGPGTGNRVLAALLKHIPALSETSFTNWDQAQILRDWFSLQPGSPALNAGPNAADMGGVIPLGASIAGEPSGPVSTNAATLRVGVLRKGFGIPATGWPQGSGYTHYKWRLDGGSWSVETPIDTQIALSELANGAHYVEVIGKRDSASYQDAPELGDDAIITRSRTWIVDPAYSPHSPPSIRLSEVLAINTRSLTNGNATPDYVELHNTGNSSIDLSGMGLTDNAANPYRFTFPTSVSPLGPGEFLVLLADAQNSLPGIHLGFKLNGDSGTVLLHDSLANDGALIDSVSYGLQIADYSLGRAKDGSWLLSLPTPGSETIAVPLANQHSIKINEWLADELFLGTSDFVELYNAAALPTSLSGCFISDSEGSPDLVRLPPLSFIGPHGYSLFLADGNPAQGPTHLGFKLDPNVGVILLSDPALSPIDVIQYGPQQTDIAQGRSPSGNETVASFIQPTPGAPNPGPSGGSTSVTNISAVSANLITIDHPWKYDNSGGTNLGSAWLDPNFDDSKWNSGLGLFGSETTPAKYPYPFRTTIPAPNQAGGKITVYYRTHFQWDGSLSNVTLVSTNYIDDGAVFYLNGVKAASLRVPGNAAYNTFASDQPNEGAPEILVFTNQPAIGDNVMAVEVHQVNASSTDDVFGMQLNALQFSTNIVNTSTGGVPIVLNEILANNRSFTNAYGRTPDWIELYNPTTNAVDLGDLSLTDDLNMPRRFVFLGDAVIPPGQYLIIYCDRETPASTNNTGFSLNSEGGSVFLFNAIAGGGGLIDSITYGLQAGDFSVGRVPNGSGPWKLAVPTSAAQNIQAGLGSLTSLHFNEWMADPLSGSDWFELFNDGTLPVQLTGCYLTDDLAQPALSPVAPLSFIGTGPHAFLRFQADGSLTSGPAHVNFKLSKSGETLGLSSPAGNLVTALSFGPQTPGVSQGRLPDGATNIVSFPGTDSGGESNYLPLPNIVINEILSHGAPSFENAIEFLNTGAQPSAIGSWFVSDSKDNLKKYRIEGPAVLQPGEFKVLYDYQFNSSNSPTRFQLSPYRGGQVFVSEADSAGNLTGYRTMVSYGPADTNVSFGRYINSAGAIHFVAMSSPAFGINDPPSVEVFRTGNGGQNTKPSVGPLVVNEIMYHPPEASPLEDNTQDEYVELQNISDRTLELFDPLAPTNTWELKGGIDFTFPTGTTLLPGAYLLLVNFNPEIDTNALAHLVTHYKLPSSSQVLGPYTGNLSNNGGALTLLKPGLPQLLPAPDGIFVPHITVEKVEYSSMLPWPSASGNGFSLQRKLASEYGNDPANWFSAAPTPAHSNKAEVPDANNDGLPDAWQTQFFGSPDDPRAAPSADPDNDGFANAEEFLIGTNPTDPSSLLKMDTIALTTTGTSLTFTAVEGKSYTIQYCGDLKTGSWSRFADVPPQAGTGPVTVQAPAESSNEPQFYRIVCPQLP